MEISKPVPDDSKTDDSWDYESAIERAGTGKFHYCLLIVCGFVICSASIGMMTMSFVMPSAECDFRLTSVDKGVINVSPFLGMIMGSFVWGSLADSQGRKHVLVAALLIDAFGAFASSLSQPLWLFLVFRFLSGFGVSGETSIIFPYLGEFQTLENRGTMLCWLEVFWSLGITILPVMAWVIIPLPWSYEASGFKYNSWRAFVTATGIPSLLGAVLLMLYPESPKFLMSQNRMKEALDVFRRIFEINTGNPRNIYPVASLAREQLLSVSFRNDETLMRKYLKYQRTFVRQLKALFVPPQLTHTALAFTVQFGLMTSYYTLILWFPELFDRFDRFYEINPNSTAAVCDVSTFVFELASNSTDRFCDHSIPDSVYQNTLIVGAACIPPSIFLATSVKYLGRKFFLIFSLLASGLCTIGLYFVQTSTQNLILSCIFEAMTGIAISVICCLVVEIFPTNLRAMAVSLSFNCGRLGAILGNVLFGYLIDLHCLSLICILTGLLFGSAGLSLLFPNTSKTSLS